MLQGAGQFYALSQHLEVANYCCMACCAPSQNATVHTSLKEKNFRTDVKFEIWWIYKFVASDIDTYRFQKILSKWNWTIKI